MDLLKYILIMIFNHKSTHFYVSFFYNDYGDYMKVYVDLLLFFNFIIDFLLLLSVSKILKRDTNINKLIVGSFIGSLSTLFVFLNISSIQLFIFKLIISIFMCILTFNFKNINYTLKNATFLFISGIILGGALYGVDNQINIKNKYLLLLLSPFIVKLYIKQMKLIKSNYNKYYKIEIHFDNNIIKTTAFLDSGNKLMDPITKKPVILLSNNKTKNINLEKFYYVPYNTIDNSNIIKCFKPDFIFIKDIGSTDNLLVGIMENDIKIDGIDCLLNESILEG